MSTATLEKFTVITSELHLLAVARHYHLEVRVVDRMLVCTRPLEDIGTITYRAELRLEAFRKPLEGPRRKKNGAHTMGVAA